MRNRQTTDVDTINYWCCVHRFKIAWLRVIDFVKEKKNIWANEIHTRQFVYANCKRYTMTTNMIKYTIII